MLRRRPPRPASSAEVVPLSRTQLLVVLAGLLLVGGVLLYGLGYTLVSSLSAGTAPDRRTYPNNSTEKSVSIIPSLEDETRRRGRASSETTRRAQRSIPPVTA